MIYRKGKLSVGEKMPSSVGVRSQPKRSHMAKYQPCGFKLLLPQQREYDTS